MAVVQLGGVVLVNGFDLSQYLTSIEPTASQDLKDSTNFASQGAHEFVVGLYERMIKAGGFFAYNAVTDAKSIDKLFNDALAQSSSQLISVCHQGAVDVGDLAIMMNTVAAKYGVTTKIGEIIATTFEAKATKLASGAYDFARGVWLMSQVVSGAVNGVGYDNTLTTTKGWYVNVHNTDADGGLSVKIQHSTNNSTWVDLITIAGMSTNSATQSIDVNTTTVNRYVRAIVTAIGGTTAKASIAMKIGYTGS